jgi:sulfate transport system ATP-binding protein
LIKSLDNVDQQQGARVTIQVRDVDKRFGNFQALDGVSLDVPGGSLTALLGPSGSGKSTLLRVIAGLEPPDAGTVLLNGVDVTNTPPQSRGVGFVFQHYAAFRHMTVWDNVAFGLQVRHRPKAEIRDRVAELLKLVQLEGYAGRYPAQLSGGQRQRMALARALAVQPAVMLLDEPFGALDARVRKELRDWLRRLHDDVHVTTVLVTHDQEEAMEVADRVVVMDHGEVQQVGSPRELYEQPANAFVMSFVGPVNHLDGALVRPHDLAIYSSPNPATREATVERLTHLGFEVRVELALADGGDRLWSQITRDDLERMELVPRQRVFVEPLRLRTFDDAESNDVDRKVLVGG